jgi:hypothetical protein
MCAITVNLTRPQKFKPGYYRARGLLALHQMQPVPAYAADLHLAADGDEVGFGRIGRAEVVAAKAEGDGHAIK